MKFCLEICYNGSLYNGWQKQKARTDKPSVQEIIEDKLKIILKDDVKIHSASRTDKGVHAWHQVCHFVITDTIINEEKFLYSLNSLLKKETIQIKSIKQTDDNFHARHSCKQKTYLYQFAFSKIKNPFLNQTWIIQNYNKNLCIDDFVRKAQKIANLLIGTFDFSSFKDSSCQSNNFIRTIEKIEFKKHKMHISILFQGKSFLQYQIRIMTGTIIEIALKNQDPEKILTILNARSRSAAGPTAPAVGLILYDIEY